MARRFVLIVALLAICFWGGGNVYGQKVLHLQYVQYVVEVRTSGVIALRAVGLDNLPEMQALSFNYSGPVYSGVKPQKVRLSLQKHGIQEIELNGSTVNYDIDFSHLGYEGRVYIAVTPLRKIDQLVQRIACVDTENPYAEENSLKFGLSWIDPINENVNNKSSVYIQYALKSTSDSNYKDWHNLASGPFPPFILNFRAAPEFYNKELKLRLCYVFSDPGEEASYLHTDVVDGIYFIEKPNFTVDIKEPVCYTDKTSININNLPDHQSPAILRLDVKKLHTQKSGDHQKEHLGVDGETYYMNNAATITTDIPGGQTSISMNTINGFPINNGVYEVEAFFYDGTTKSSLCPSRVIKKVHVDTLKLKLSGPAKIGTSTYHIGANGGTCQLTGSVEGQQGTYTLNYEKTGLSGVNPWSSGTTGFSAGSYNLWVSDSKGCKSDTIENLRLSEPAPLNVTLSALQPDCHASNTSVTNKETGQIGVTINSGGIGDYKAVLYNSSNKELESISDIVQGSLRFFTSRLAPGTYKVRVFNHNTYQAFESTQTITSPALLNIDKVVIDDVSCYGGNNGQATITASGGAGGYKFGTSDKLIEDDTTIDALSAGDYTFYVKDTNGCLAQSTTKKVAQPSGKLSITPKALKPETCDATDGSVEFDISGGWAGDYPYVLTINTNPQRTITINSGSLSGIKATHLSNGTYKVDVRNGRGCIASNTFTIEESNPLRLTAKAGSLPNCSGKADGSIVLTIDGGSGAPGASYALDTPETTFNTISKTIDKLRDGTYNYTVSDERACVASTGDFQLKVADQPLGFAPGFPSSVNSSCREGTDGILEVKGLDGKKPDGSPSAGFKYSLDGTSFTGLRPGTETYRFTGKTTGTYTLYIEDEAGCVVQQQVTLTNDSDPLKNIVTVISDESCPASDNGVIALNKLQADWTDDLSFTVGGKLIDKAGKVSADKTSLVYSGLNAGSYPVTVLNTVNRCEESFTVDIADLEHDKKINIQATTTIFPACDMAENGELGIKVGRTGYTGIWTLDLNGGTSDGAKAVNQGFDKYYTGLDNTTYTIMAVDKNNCSKQLPVAIPLSDNAAKLTRPIITQPTCLAAKNGRIEVSAGGGVALPGGEYNFYLTDNTDNSYNQHITGVSATFIGLYPDHNYTLKVMDSEGCSDEKPLGMLGHLPLISLSEPTKTAPLCYQDENGKINLTIGNLYEARVNYSYELFKADADNHYQSIQSHTDKTEEYTGLGDGRYMIKVSGDDHCTASYPGIDLLEPEPIAVDKRQYSCISTHGQETGWFSIDFKLGSLHYDVEWIKADGTKEILDLNLPDTKSSYQFKRDKLAPGRYTFRLKDKNNCDYFDGAMWYETSVTITQPEPLEISFSKTDESCADYDDGQISVSAKGGWLCPATEHTDCQNPAHDNCLEWKDNACGSQDYLYSKDDKKAEWQCENVFNALEPGTYDISVMDKAGNIATTSVEILARPKLTIQNIDAFPASCPGYDNGRIAATIENGVFITDHLDYTINNETSGDLIIAKEDDRNYTYGKLPAGTYTLQVTDLNACVDKQDFTIGEPEAPEIKITHNYIRKKEEATGVIDVEVTKGNGVFNFEWYKNAEVVSFDNGQTTKAISLKDLLAGAYTLKVQDTAKCVYETSDWMERQVQMVEPELPLSFKVKENTPVTCHGLTDGILEVTPIGGWGDYTYSINAEPEQVSPRYEGRPAGNYTITVKDSAGITWQNTIELVQPDVLIASFKAKQDVRCFAGSDGSIELDINGGNLSYQVSVDNARWYDGTKVPDLPIGTYTVYVQDPKNCLTQVDNISLDQPAKIELADSEIIKSRCSNDEGQIFSSYKGGVGAYTYAWQKDTVLADGTTDHIGLPYVTADIDGLYSAVYTVEVRDGHDCPMEFEYFVGDITDLAIESIDVTDVSCWDYADGEAKATVVRGNPDYTYTWSKSITNVDKDKAWGIKAGIYKLLVRDQKHCAVYQQFTVGTPDSLYYDIVDMEHPLCLGGEQGHIEIQGTGGTPAYKYQWSTGSTTNHLSDVVPGDYVLGISDAHNCYSEFTIPFTYQRTVVPFVGNDTLICHYDALPVDAGHYEQFKWTSLNGFKSNEQRVVVSEPDTYYLEVTDADRCLGYDTLKLDVSYLQIAGLNVKDVTCNNFANGEAHVEVSPATWPHTIEWTDASGENTWLNLSGGDYSVRVFDEYGCEDKRDFAVYEPEALGINVNKLMQPLCYGVPDGRIELAAIGGVGNYRYEWLHGVTKPTITKLDTGTYVVDLYDANDCHLREHYEMAYVRTIYPKLGNDLTVCEGNNAKLYPGEFYSYQWFKNDVEVGSDTALIVLQADTYRVEVQDDSNCIGRDTMSLSTYATDVTPEFLTATSVAAGDTLIMVEVTQPKPQQIDWAFTGEYEVVEQGDYFCKVIFTEQGMRELTLNAHTSDCFAQARKTILVTPPGTGSSDEGEVSNTAYQNLLKLGVSPNPTDGFFSVSIELSGKAPVNIYLVDMGSGKIIEQRKREGMDIYSETYNLNKPGMYVVVVESKGEKRVGKVIVK